MAHNELTLSRTLVAASFDSTYASPFSHILSSSSYGTRIDNGYSMRTEEGRFVVSCPLFNMRPIASNPIQIPQHKTPAPYLHSFPRSTQSVNVRVTSFLSLTPFHSECVFYSYPTTLHISLLGSYHLWVMWSESVGRDSASQALERNPII